LPTTAATATATATQLNQNNKTEQIRLSAAQLGDSSLMELRECLHRFKDCATATPFSPGKFPTALRPLLNECVCVTLRAFKAAPDEPLPEALCPALASFLPFSVGALRKLLQTKILKSLKETIENDQLAKMYERWPAVVIKRLSEENSIIGKQSRAKYECLSRFFLFFLHIGPEDASPEKKPRLKFTDEMRQLLFDIIRTEIDANNLAATCNFLSLSESLAEAPISTYKVQTEMNLRRSVYAKLASIEGLAFGLISTGDLSKEFGAHKRKNDKRILRLAAACFFGEEAIEVLLKPKIVVNNAPHESLASETVTIAPVDPLINLFDDPMEM
jgi:hypothetical protein